VAQRCQGSEGQASHGMVSDVAIQGRPAGAQERGCVRRHHAEAKVVAEAGARYILVCNGPHLWLVPCAQLRELSVGLIRGNSLLHRASVGMLAKSSGSSFRAGLSMPTDEHVV
jgi:hypothetical protein